MRIKPLPPLNSLVAFEAAARHLSFTQASIELCVTQSAISRQIRHLEDVLATPLFVRDKRQLKLTAIGQVYFRDIQSTLNNLAKSTEKVIAEQQHSYVTLITSNAIASLWLLPKLPYFEQLYPETEIRILATDSLKKFRADDYDIALFYSRRFPENMQATLLFKESVFPVCSPNYLKKIQTDASTDPGLLLNSTLLYLDTEEDWLSWDEWFKTLHMANIQPKKRIRLNNYPLLMQAALNGQGIALGWSQLIDDYLTSGLLVRPVVEHLETQSGFYLFSPTNIPTQKTGVAQLTSWLHSVSISTT